MNGTRNMKMNRTNRVRAMAASAVLTVSAAGLVAVTSAGQPSAAEDPPADASFDPVLVALGVDSPAEVEQLQAAQAALADELVAIQTGESTGLFTVPGLQASARSADPQVSYGSTEVVSIVSDWDEAQDDLYDRVKARPEAAAMRAIWLECMAEAGIVLDDRPDLELHIQQLPPAEVASAASAADACDSETQPALNTALRSELPTWSAEHEEEITDYRALLGLDQ